MSYTTDQLLLAAKVFEMSKARQTKAAEAEALQAGISASDVPEWMSDWLAKNPREQFVDDVLEDLADIVDIIERRRSV